LLLALRNPTDMTEPDMEKFAPLPGVLTVAMTKGLLPLRWKVLTQRRPVWP
jgi:hypothetical protein